MKTNLFFELKQRCLRAETPLNYNLSVVYVLRFSGIQNGSKFAGIELKFWTDLKSKDQFKNYIAKLIKFPTIPKIFLYLNHTVKLC